MKLNNINNRKLKDASLTKVETEEWDMTDEKIIKEGILKNMEQIGKQYPEIASDCPNDAIRVTAQIAIIDSYKNGWIDAIKYYNALLSGMMKKANESI